MEKVFFYSRIYSDSSPLFDHCYSTDDAQHALYTCLKYECDERLILKLFLEELNIPLIPSATLFTENEKSIVMDLTWNRYCSN